MAIPLGRAKRPGAVPGPPVSRTRSPLAASNTTTLSLRLAVANSHRRPSRSCQGASESSSSSSTAGEVQASATTAGADSAGLTDSATGGGGVGSTATRVGRAAAAQAARPSRLAARTVRGREGKAGIGGLSAATRADGKGRERDRFIAASGWSD